MSSSGRRGNNWRGRWRGGGGNRGRGRGGNSSGGSKNRSSGPSNSSQDNRPQQHQPRQVQASLNPSPYKKWHMYFPDDVYIPDSPLVEKIEAFRTYFEQHITEFSKDDIERRGSVTVTYTDLINDNGLHEKLPLFAAELKEQPESTLQCVGLAMYQVIVSGESSQPAVTALIDFPYIQARVINYEPITALMNLKANYFGKFVAIRGTVVRVSNVKPLVTKMTFSCNLCGESQCIPLPDGKYRIPAKCPSRECRGRSFTPQRSSPLTSTIDWQTVSCVPGDMVTVTGSVKVTNSEESRNRFNKDKCMFLLYVHANAVNNNKGSIFTGEPESGLSMEFSLKELYAIQEIQAEKNLFRLIVGSLCPSIYGHEMVKAGLMLGLFGGTQRYLNDKNRIPVRGNPHVLVVGDPGLGKSQMLRAVSNVAPRGVYVCGNTTSISGLTVTLTKDGSSGDYALEAGALVLGDQGCCCIDEFDKMGNQHQALLEAMEQQSISLAKAGIVCSLPARTSIIAAANPVGGHYNKAKTVSENLKMGSALLSRFDLVFILLDKPDEEMDCLLSEHVMALHAGKKSAFGSVTVRRPTEESSDEEDEARQQWEADKPLSERLKISNNQSIDPIPGSLLRKYVGYARKYVHPKLTAAAAKVIQEFYLSLRREYQGGDSTPITTRQLESLIRLTEARARLELREKATRRDAEDVVYIMKHSLVDTYNDGFGNLDFQRSQHGSGMSTKAMGKHFIAELGKIADREYNSLFTIDQMRQVVKDLRLQIRSLEDFICSLNNQGFLLKKGPRVYQLQIASCL